MDARAEAMAQLAHDVAEDLSPEVVWQSELSPLSSTKCKLQSREELEDTMLRGGTKLPSLFIEPPPV